MEGLEQRLRTEGVPADLRSLDLRGCDLSKLDLRERDLRGVDLSGANLEGAQLAGARLDEACLREAHMVRAELLGASLERADLSGANAEECGLGRTTLDGADLSGAKLGGASASHATLRGAVLSGACLKEVRLCSADLRECDFNRSDLRGADLSGAQVSGASFVGVDLRSARLADVTGYIKADWTEVDLRDVDFRRAHQLRRFILDENYLREFRTRSKGAAVLYQLWKLTSDCGRSLLRWGAFIAVVVCVFAALFSFVAIDYGERGTWLAPLYFSVVTLTTLGYGDIVPSSAAAQALVIAEVVVGYVGLGGLLAIFSNKIARRAD